MGEENLNETTFETGNSDDLNISESLDSGNSDTNISESDENGENSENQTNKGRFDDLEKANQSYAELEKKLGEQSNELGELRKKAELAEQLQARINEQELQIAKRNGFDTVEDYEDNIAIGSFLADEYSKFVNSTEYPEETAKLIDEYRQHPSKELLETIEAELPIGAIKEVAGKLSAFKGQLQSQKDEALQNDLYNSAKIYLEENTKKYPEEFKNPAFAALYGEAFKAYGCDLNTEVFVGLMNEYKKSVLASAGIQQEIDKENSNATAAIEGATLSGSQNYQEKDVLNMSEAELKRELAKY